MLLLLKLVLVPVLIAGVTLVARRWGPRVGGLVTALPVVAGPTLCFYAVEQGNAFAASAARATVLGLVAVGAFCVVYAWSATRATWPLSLLAGWLAFSLVTGLLYRAQLSLLVDLAVAVAALLGARHMLPSLQFVPAAVRAPVWDLPLRMAAAAALVLALTSLADRLGPGLSGVLTAFPVATAIIAGFTHAQHGPEPVVRFFRGFLPALCSFALFCFLLAATLPTSGLPLALAAALAGQLVLQGLVLWRIGTTTPAPPDLALDPPAVGVPVTGRGSASLR